MRSPRRGRLRRMRGGGAIGMVAVSHAKQLAERAGKSLVVGMILDPVGDLGKQPLRIMRRVLDGIVHLVDQAMGRVVNGVLSPFPSATHPCGALWTRPRVPAVSPGGELAVTVDGIEALAGR